MSGESDVLTHRILVIDDNASIHDDYRKILAGQEAGKMSAAEAALFGEQRPTFERPTFDVDSAMQGRDGVEMARRALAEGRPYAVAFGDMRMPPGWDGLETIENLWKVDPEIQVVVCSAYSDYDWMELLARLGRCDKLIVIKKPFEPIEILQSASSLSRKWQNARALKRHIEGLERVVTDRTRGLEAANRQLQHLASHDSLTGLPNRLLLDDRLMQAKRDQEDAAVGPQQNAAGDGEAAPDPGLPPGAAILRGVQTGGSGIERDGNKEDAQGLGERGDGVVRGEGAERGEGEGDEGGAIGDGAAGQVGDEEAAGDVDDNLHQQHRVVVLAAEEHEAGGEERGIAGQADERGMNAVGVGEAEDAAVEPVPGNVAVDE